MADKLTKTDRILIEWVAEGRIGQPLPEEWPDTNALIQHLVEIGVVYSAVVGMPIFDAALAAQKDCREWLDANK